MAGELHRLAFYGEKKIISSMIRYFFLCPLMIPYFLSIDGTAEWNALSISLYFIGYVCTYFT